MGEETPGTASNWAGLAEGDRVILWVFERGRALRQKPASLQNCVAFVSYGVLVSKLILQKIIPMSSLYLKKEDN